MEYCFLGVFRKEYYLDDGSGVLFIVTAQHAITIKVGLVNVIIPGQNTTFMIYLGPSHSNKRLPCSGWHFTTTTLQTENKLNIKPEYPAGFQVDIY